MPSGMWSGTRIPAFDQNLVWRRAAQVRPELAARRKKKILSNRGMPIECIALALDGRARNENNRERQGAQQREKHDGKFQGKVAGITEVLKGSRARPARLFRQEVLMFYCRRRQKETEEP